MYILREGVKEYARKFTCECKICNCQVQVFWGDPEVLGFKRKVDSGCIDRYIYDITWACPTCNYKNTTDGISGTVSMLNYSQREMRERYRKAWERTKDISEEIDECWTTEDGTAVPDEDEYI